MHTVPQKVWSPELNFIHRQMNSENLYAEILFFPISSTLNDKHNRECGLPNEEQNFGKWLIISPVRMALPD